MRLFVAALLVASGIGGQSTPAPPPPPATPTTPATPASPSSPGRLVTVDLSVTDARGRTLTDLKPTDFELREGSTVLPLESVRLVRVGPASQAEQPARIQSAADERLAAGQEQARLFAIYLDEYHVASGVETNRVREALIRFIDRDLSPDDLIVVMKPLDSLFTIRLTRDRDAVRQAIENFEGRKGDYEPRNSYEREFMAATPARVEAARAQVALSAINALAIHLGSLTDRRKTLIVVTETVGHADRRRGLDNLPTLETIIRSANRSNVAVYPFDPRDVVDGQPEGADLRRLADETDGKPIEADADAGLRRVTADSSAYYLLSFRTSHPDDGQFRELLARVKRAGAVVRSRKGYWTASPDEALRTALIAKANAPKVTTPVEPPPHASTLIRPWFGVARGDNGRTRVTFVWEPAAHVPGDRVRRTASKLEFQARSADGAVLYEGPVAPTGAGTIEEAAGTPVRVIFDAPPGVLRLRMSIQDAAATVLDQDIRQMSIRDLKGDVAIGTPEVLRARNAREFRALESEGAVPVVSREFSRTERLLIRFRAYGPAGQTPVVSAKLLDRVGHVIHPLDIIPAQAPGESAIDLPLAGFAPGDYTIELKSTGGNHEAVERMPFRVTY